MRRLFRTLAIRPAVIARCRRAVDADRHGVRRAMLFGAALGLLWAMPARLWMRLITDQEPVFSIGGTLFIFIVVSGFGAAAGYAFAVRPRVFPGRIRRWSSRGLAFVPFAAMGPGLIFFGGLAPLALAITRRGWRRRYRIALYGAGGLLLTFATLVMTSAGAIATLIFVFLSYLLFLSLRFALEPAAPRDEPADGAFRYLTA